MMWTEKCAENEVGKMRVRRRDMRIWFFALGVFAAVFLFTFFGSYILPFYGNCGIIMLFPNNTIKFGGKRNGILKFSKNFNCG